MLGWMSSMVSEASSHEGVCSTRQSLPTAELTRRASPSQAPTISSVLRLARFFTPVWPVDIGVLRKTRKFPSWRYFALRDDASTPS